eukprot:jgi/Chrzof1/4600/Cz14g19220.t1
MTDNNEGVEAVDKIGGLTWWDVSLERSRATRHHVVLSYEHFPDESLKLPKDAEVIRKCVRYKSWALEGYDKARQYLDGTVLAFIGKQYRDAKVVDVLQRDGTGIDIEFITDKGDTQRKTVALTKLWEIDSRDVMTHPALAAWMKGDKSGTSPSTSVQTPLLPPTSVQTSKAKVIPVYTVRDPPTSELYGTEWMLTIPASVAINVLKRQESPKALSGHRAGNELLLAVIALPQRHANANKQPKKRMQQWRALWSKHSNVLSTSDHKPGANPGGKEGATPSRKLVGAEVARGDTGS